MYVDGFSFSYSNAPISDEVAEAFLKIVEGLNAGLSFDQSISNVISEEADSFFKGGKSDTEVARIIQERVQTVVNERL